ncbi:uncharacterized protein BCR38DRAFT_47431 [Pseudomassariella vexata]|uniref:Uncharacterized protein n=1 Tax=Pseudomassariella vexata TaxID=1141098 RepID=A0A1Y2DNS3_9PEZI|nr:uncharacterized protein BCR38DRAFT_47431 [Pseudomassariella vexata]ORY60814.1 hypothetical protein BCR38DRAFT_47431 [Pseudomassariella vexata]
MYVLENAHKKRYTKLALGDGAIRIKLLAAPLLSSRRFQTPRPRAMTSLGLRNRTLRFLTQRSSWKIPYRRPSLCKNWGPIIWFGIYLSTRALFASHLYFPVASQCLAWSHHCASWSSSDAGICALTPWYAYRGFVGLTLTWSSLSCTTRRSHAPVIHQCCRANAIGAEPETVPPSVVGSTSRLPNLLIA